MPVQRYILSRLLMSAWHENQNEFDCSAVSVAALDLP